MKKFLSLLLAAMLLLSCIPAMAEDDPEWKINQYTGLVSRKSAAEKLESIVIPAEVNGMAVRGIEYMAFNMHKNFKQLTIADNAAMLDRRVLRDLLKLEVVDLPENLLIIREGNFTNLPKLTSVVIPANVVLVHSSFNKCASLTSITFEGMCPLFVTEGTFGMFTELPADCVIYVPDDQLESYKEALADRADVVARLQPSGQKAIRVSWPVNEGDFQFDAATGTITGYTGTANYLKIPASIGGVQVKHIADDALLQKHSLCCIVVPEGVESLGAASLAGVENLSYVSLPSTLTSVGDSAFSVSRVSAISYNTASVPVYDAAAFTNIKSDAWQLILPFGTSQEQVDAFAAYMAAGAPKGVTKASIIEPYSFPKLDAEAGAPFIGNWNAVAVFDGVDYYGMDLLGISMIVNLQGDGTGVVDMDGDATTGGWYVEDGTVVFAPILEEGGQPVPEEAMTFTMDENGRMVLDLGGLYLLLEMEGKTYAVPAIPEKPWPELDQSNAKYFIGTWEAVSYIMEGETYSAELMGKMMLTLNDDGTATSVEPGEEPYELRWYADYGTAYVGPAMSALAKITFDGNGNIKMEQDGMSIIMAPYVEKTVIEGADELLGDWYDDLGNKLTVVNDGTMTYTYASDGWVNEYKWNVVDGAAVVTEGNWAGAAIYLQDGIVFVDNGEGIFQLFSVDGDLSAYYGDDEGYELPEAQPIGPEGEAYFGAWKADMYGMEVIMTLNQDGTCTMDMMGEVEPGVWAVVDGKANVMGDELYIDGEGNLVYEGAGMVFTKTEDGASSEEMSDEEMLLALLALMGQMEGMEGGEEESVPANDTIFGRWEDKAKYVDVYKDGRIEMTYKSDGYVSHMAWKNVDGVPTGSDGLWKGMPIVVENGNLVITMDTYYQEFTYVGEAPNEVVESVQPVEGDVNDGDVKPAAPAAGNDDYIGTKFVLTGASINGINLSAEQLNAAGDYVIFNADGSVELCMSDRMVQTLGWTRGKVNVVGAEHDGFCVDYYGTYYNFGITGDGLILDYFGTPRFYEPEGGKEEVAPVAPAATEAPAVEAAPAATFSSYEDYMDIKFVAKTYTSFGNTVDASSLGAEYAVTFHANGSCEFVMAGVNTPGLTWGLQEISMGLTKQEAFVINYYGVMYNFIPTATGFDMDFYGTMNLHFVPAE